MKEQLIHILDQSVCLTRKQMKEYLGGAMLPEEMHAVEIHLNSCPLCSMAMEGFEEHSDAALEAIASLNSGFLKEHFANISPQIHLNSLAPAAALPANASAHHRRGTIQPLLRTASIAAAVLLAFGALWYVEFGNNPKNNASSSSPIAMAYRQSNPAAPATQPESKERTAGYAAAAQPLKASPAAANKPSAGVKAKESVSNNGSKTQALNLAAGPAKDFNSDSIEPSARSADGSIAMEPSKRPDQEPVVSAYRASLVPPPAETVEKSTSRKVADVASFSAPNTTASNGLSMGGGRASGTKYMVDGVRLKAGMATPAGKEEPSALEKGDASFDKGKYSAALTHYRQGMNSGAARDRDRAAIRAAQCYAALGNKSKAEELLNKVMDQAAGPERRAARRILRSLHQD